MDQLVNRNGKFVINGSMDRVSAHHSYSFNKFESYRSWLTFRLCKVRHEWCMLVTFSIIILFCQVRVSMFKNREEKMFLEFNTVGSLVNNFFQQARLVHSSYHDLTVTTATPTVFAIEWVWAWQIKSADGIPRQIGTWCRLFHNH